MLYDYLMTLSVEAVEANDAPWTTSREKWLTLFQSRNELTCGLNREIADHFAQKEPLSSVALATAIASKITGPLNQIAFSQFEESLGGEIESPKSWKEVDYDASADLDTQIDAILADENYKDFFIQNPSIKMGLELMKNTLIGSSDPAEIFEKHSVYMEACVEANAQGKPTFYFPLGSDFTAPLADVDEIPPICEATISVLLPLNQKEREHFDKLTALTWGALEQRERALCTSRPLKTYVGYDVMGLGFQALNTTVGETFTYVADGPRERGFYLAVNRLAKRENYWGVASQLPGDNFITDNSDFENITTLLYVLHEQGHVLFPKCGLLGEVPADLPTVILALDLAESLGFDSRKVVVGILAEYASNVIDNPPVDGNPDKDGDPFSGYAISGILILNALLDSGLVMVNGEELEINLKKQNDLITLLEGIDGKFHGGNVLALENIKKVQLNDEAREVIDLFRQKMALPNQARGGF